MGLDANQVIIENLVFEKDKKDNPKIKAIEDILDKLGVDKEEILKLINKENKYLIYCI